MKNSWSQCSTLSLSPLLFWSLVYIVGIHFRAPQMVLVVKNTLANAGDTRDVGLLLGSGRFVEEDMTVHPSILIWRIPMDRGAWRSTVYRVPPRQT